MIAVSGYPDADIRDARLAAGFEAYLIKPRDIPELERPVGDDGPTADASTH